MRKNNMNIDELKHIRKLLLEKIQQIDEEINNLESQNLMITPSFKSSEILEYEDRERRKKEVELQESLNTLAFMFSADFYDWR